MHQPPAEGNAVCFIVEFLRVNGGKVLQLRVFQDLRVQGGNAVDGKAVMDIHARHVYQVVFIDDSQGGGLILFLHPAIQLPNNGNQLGNRFL